MSLFSSLKREQKEAIGLLQIGTFLEYFDLMLYVHMAVLLNDLFFPKADPHTAALLTAFAFCSTYVLRPFGALLFGYIGDNIGRKTTVIMTTMMMALSCIIMANLPTYSQIGISAAWIVTLCRILQGLSSMGEICGANIYLTEITKIPERYPIVASTSIFTSLGPVAALAIASLVTTVGFNWRVAFWIGACIALVGSVARTRLRETPEFIDMKRKMKKAIEESHHDGLGKAAQLLKSINLSWKKKVNKETLLAYLLVQCGWPVFFYFSYMYCSIILKNQFGYTPEQIIHQNFMVSLFQLSSFTLGAIICAWIYPLKILKIKTYILCFLILALPFIMNNLTSPFHLFLVQSLFIFFSLTNVPAVPIFLIHFPVYNRFTYDSFIYALSRALMYIVTSFGIVYLTDFFGYMGLWFIMIPTTIAFLWGVNHFEKLEKQFETPTLELNNFAC
jgi:MFS family permease